MDEKSSFTRRDMLKISSVAVGACLSRKLFGSARFIDKNSIQEAAYKVGRLPRRKMGFSGREISVLIGAGDLDPVCTEAGILCGMNYWHKADRWVRNGAPDSVLKNREAHYCQVTVDRVGGSHYEGSFDEEEHYAFVKDAVKKTGLRYFDDMQLHFGYHNSEELKKERGFVRAFERLKKEGLVKHLCLSQHSYLGNSRISDGQGAAEVLTAVVEDGIFEHAQFMFSYGADPETDRFINFAQKHGFGTIAMKTARGIGRLKQDRAFMRRFPAGTSPHHALVRWLIASTGLDAAVVRVKNLDEFIETYSGAGKDMRDVDTGAIALMTAQADKSACRLCARCQPHCPRQVPIAEIFRFERYALDDHDWRKAKSLYNGLPRRADACNQCNICIEYCPQKLIIPEKLTRAHSLLG